MGASSALFFLSLALAACSARPSSNAEGTALDSELAAELAGGGVNCLPGQPPPFAACASLDAGAACTFPATTIARRPASATPPATAGWFARRPTTTETATAAITSSRSAPRSRPARGWTAVPFAASPFPSARP